MGIVNLTPDSFSGDGLVARCDEAISYAYQQIKNGADIIDLGAESSRPGAFFVSASDEIKRLVPVLDALQGCGVPISVDTCKPAVMEAALLHGASMINDINALQAPDALAILAKSDCGICLMHMQGAPQTMQAAPVYSDVVAEIAQFLQHRVQAAIHAGIARERLVLDPGFGFGKTLQHNLALLRNLSKIAQMDGLPSLPILVGLSRKSMLGELTGRPVGERSAASVIAALLAVERGARLVRVHDVAQTKDALTILEAVGEGDLA